MEREQIVERMESLMQSRAQLQQDMNTLQVQLQEGQAGLSQLASNINAFNGAIQECEHWLSVIDSTVDPALVTLVPPPESPEPDGKPEVVVPILGRSEAGKSAAEVLAEEAKERECPVDGGTHCEDLESVPPPGPEIDDE